MAKSIYDCNCKQGELIRKLEVLTASEQKMYAAIFEAFLQHKNSYLNTATEYGKKVEGLVKELTEQVLNLSKDDSGINSHGVLELLKAVEQIKYGGDKITQSVTTKINDEVLFSDKAVTELRDIFGVVIDTLKQSNDLIATGNLVIAEYIVNRADNYSKVIKGYATEHEDRLIKGICLPKSSIIYLSMLDVLEDVLWNIKAIGNAFK